MCVSVRTCVCQCGRVRVSEDVCESLRTCVCLCVCPFSVFCLLAHLGVEREVSPGSEFLSDAPFFGLSLWTELKVANCACASGRSCLMNLNLWLSSSLSSCWLRSRLVHRELEVHTVYQRFLTSWQRPTPKDISGYFACLYQVCS